MKRKPTIRAMTAAVASTAALLGATWSAPVAACSIEPFLASVCIFAGNFAIRGFAFAHGQLLSISQNTAVFALMGTTYGGNGTTNFALPDTRGRVVVGAGQGPGLSNYFLGQMGGTEQVTLTLNNIPAHTHSATSTLTNLTATATLRGNSATGNADGPAGTSLAAKPRGAQYSTSAPNVDMAAGSVTVSGGAGTINTVIGLAGGSQPFAIMPPYIALNYLVAMQGIFPPRD